jgi:hypothetical protein
MLAVDRVKVYYSFSEIWKIPIYKRTLKNQTAICRFRPYDVQAVKKYARILDKNVTLS